MDHEFNHGVHYVDMCQKCHVDQVVASNPTWSYTEQSEFKNCELKFNYRFLIGLRSREDTGWHAIRFGHAMHKALETLYVASYASRSDFQGEGDTGSPSRLSDAVQAAQDAFTEDYPPHAYPGVLPKWDVGKTWQHGMDTIADYAERWAAEDAQWEVLEAELPEEMEDRSSVHLDLVARHRVSGGVYGWDHKTSGKYLDGDFWDRFRTSDQIRRYVNHVKAKYGECAGFVINAISLKYRQKAYNRGDDQRPGKTYHHEFARMIYNPDEATLALESNNRSYWNERINQVIRSGRFGYNDGQCWKCEYSPLCSYGYTWPRDEELILETFVQVCNRATNTKRRCQLEQGHDGDHSEYPASSQVDESTSEVQIEE
jgi:hypothetical protein